MEALRDGSRPRGGGSFSEDGFSDGKPHAGGGFAAMVAETGPAGAGGRSAPGQIADEVDLLRAQQYDLLAVLLGRAPGADLLAAIARLEGDETPLGAARGALADAAARTGADRVSREFFDLFIGLGRGEFLPYASYYLSGFLHERPLARVRDDLARLGIERAEGQHEPEDHIAILCEVMAGLSAGRFEAEPGAARAFFERHIEPWAMRLFADLETSPAARFYAALGRFGRVFLELEAEAFALEPATTEQRSGPPRDGADARRRAG